MRNIEVAKTILEQLGGNKFITMTGAKHLAAGPSDLTIRLPRAFAKNGINCVKITLNLMDTYDIDFMALNYKTYNIRVVERVAGVYYDMLQGIFTEHTGLNVRL